MSLTEREERLAVAILAFEIAAKEQIPQESVNKRVTTLMINMLENKQPTATIQQMESMMKEFLEFTQGLTNTVNPDEAEKWR